MNIQFFVRSGTVATLIKRDGSSSQFRTRKDLAFLPTERNTDKRAKDEIAFERDGHTLILKKNQVTLEKSIKSIIIDGIRKLAGVCDGARARDNHGFNGTDSRYGKIIAHADFHSTRMILDAAKMMVKYQRQLDSSIIAVARSLSNVKEAVKEEPTKPDHSCEDMDGECCPA